jgi:Flp pilus assembly protein TadB
MWVKQSGTTMSISTCMILSLLLGALGAMAAATFTHLWWASAIGFAVGCCIQPAVLRQKRAARLYKFEERFPEALDLLSRRPRGTRISAE